MKSRKIALICLCLALGVLFSACSVSSGGGGGSGKHSGSNVRLAAPTYPAMQLRPNDEDMFDDYDAWEAEHAAWHNDFAAQKGYADGVNNTAYQQFLQQTAEEFLNTSGTKNSVYSPANIYMALAMLAETTDNESRAQLLSLLGMESIEDLRAQATAMWNSNYCDDGAISSILANSIWLREGTGYHDETLQRLAETYYASAFRGLMGTEEYNQMLRDWIDEQTGGLLKEHSKDLSMDPSTIMALASTIYFKAGWKDEFYEGATEPDIFHAPGGDITVNFMHSTEELYYWGEHYGAVEKQMENGCSMWLILPDEDSSVDEVLADGEALTMVSSDTWANYRSLDVHLSVPKFDIDAELDLVGGLQKLGVTDVFDPVISDFTPLTDVKDLYVSEALHAARVKIDEEGCEAAAYTVLMVECAEAIDDREEIDLILDRPFIFVITGITGLPLFVGTVCQP